MEEGLLGEVYSLVRLTFYGSMIIQFMWTAANIPIISEKVKQLLLRVPELKDFQGQIAQTNVALSGKGMFSLNRHTLLTFIGTIFTYEVILSQSNYEGSSMHKCSYNISQLT